MKKILFTFISSILIISCAKESEEAFLSVSPSTAIHFSAEAKESPVEIEVNSNKLWEVTSNQAWCIVKKGTNMFAVSAAPNTKETAPKPATITVTAEDAKPVVINVTQAIPDLLSVSSNSSIQFSAFATEAPKTIYVTTNQSSWSVVSDQTWCKVTKENNSFIVSASPNFSEQPPAVATITVSAGNAIPVKIDAIQLAAPKIGDFFYEDGSYSNDFISNVSNPCVGIVFRKRTNTQTGLIIYPKQEYGIKWGMQIITGASNNADGVVNYEAIRSQPYATKTAFPAFYYATSISALGTYSVIHRDEIEVNWYIPAKDELILMYENREAINSALGKMPFSMRDTFIDYWNWSSTESLDGNEAFVIAVSAGTQSYLPKWSTYIMARVIHQF